VASGTAAGIPPSNGEVRPGWGCDARRGASAGVAERSLQAAQSPCSSESHFLGGQWVVVERVNGVMFRAGKSPSSNGWLEILGLGAGADRRGLL